MTKKFNVEAMVTAFFALVFIGVIYGSKDLTFGARIFPLVIGIPGLGLALVQLILDSRITSKVKVEDLAHIVDVAPDHETPEGVTYAKAARFLGWLLALYLGMWLIGFKIASLFFLMLFPLVEGKVRWLIILAISVLSIYFIFFPFASILEMAWPEPIIERFVELPWFLR